MNLRIRQVPEYKEYSYFAGYHTYYFPAIVFHVPISDAKDFLAKIRKSFDDEKQNFLTKLQKEIPDLFIEKIILERAEPFFSISSNGVEEEEDFVSILLKVSYYGNDKSRDANVTIAEKCAYFVDCQWAEFFKNKL